MRGKPRGIGKRAADVAVAAPLAVFTAPLLLVLLFGSWLAYRCTPMFVQPRLGLDGEEFRFAKVRSLPPTVGTDVAKDQLIGIANARFGQWLRRYHLDELPQLWLVITGAMALVGPRPEMPRLAATYDLVFVKERCTVRPGVTGLWQVSDASAGIIGHAPEYDLHYVAHQTLRLDVWILWRTARIVLGGPYVSGLDAIPRWTGAATSSRGAPETSTPPTS